VVSRRLTKDLLSASGVAAREATGFPFTDGSNQA